jgi:lipid-A-disaccharide synthase
VSDAPAERSARSASSRRAAQLDDGAERRKGIVLFTAFEPSGDAHAAPVIAALRRRAPDLPICAWGGPRMADAGAQLVATTAEDGAMGLVGLRKIASVRRHIRAIADWAKGQRILVHVPVDSPAANFPVVAALKPSGVRVAHLVAPQMWAWGSWRVAKLRRLTDVVLCLLPFEEEWFRSRRVPAKFIGHPVINREVDLDAIRARQGTLPTGAPRILILPGSRSGEVRSNLRLLVSAYLELADRHRGIAGLVVAANQSLARLCREVVADWPVGLHLAVNDGGGLLEAAIHWCDLALNVSGTVSLDLTRQHRPMIGLWRGSVVSWLGSKLVLRTPHRLLPNIIAGRRIVPEFVPAPPWMGPGPIVAAASELLKDSKRLAVAAEELRRVQVRFHGHHPDEEAVETILRLVSGRAIDDPRPMPPPTVDPVEESA